MFVNWKIFEVETKIVVRIVMRCLTKNDVYLELYICWLRLREQFEEKSSMLTFNSPYEEKSELSQTQSTKF